MHFVGAGNNYAPPPIDCMAAERDPLGAAFELSFRNGVLFPGFTSARNQNQIYRCLYGVEADDGNLSAQQRSRLPPAVPAGVAILGLMQNLYSAGLIFLFLLAVRNHFRIK